MIRVNKRISLSVLAIALGILGLISCSLWNGGENNRILLSGNIEFTQAHIAFKSSGKLIDFPIEEGDTVRKSMVLARLDMQQQEKQRDRERAALAVAETSLAQHRTGIEYLQASMEADILARQAQLRRAEANLDQLLAGSRSQEIQKAHAAVEQAASQLSLAKDEWDRAQVLYKNDDISTSQFDRYRSQFTAARAAVDQADQQYLLVQEGPRKEDIEAARAGVEQAASQLSLAKDEWDRAQVLYKNDDISTSQFDRYRSQFTAARAAVDQADQQYLLVQEGPRKEDIEAARAGVEQARAALQQTEATRLEVKRKEQEIKTRQAQIDQARAQVAFMDAVIADGTATAPFDGVILEKSAEIGEVVAAGTTVATLGDINRPWLRGYIREQDHGRVKLGMKVRITTDSYPDKVYEGRLSYIASEAEFTPKQIQTPEERVKLVYRIKIEVGNPRQELKLNMPASAEILLENNESVQR